MGSCCIRQKPVCYGLKVPSCMTPMFGRVPDVEEAIEHSATLPRSLCPVAVYCNVITFMLWMHLSTACMEC